MQVYGNPVSAKSSGPQFHGINESMANGGLSPCEYYCMQLRNINSVTLLRDADHTQQFSVLSK